MPSGKQTTTTSDKGTTTQQLDPVIQGNLLYGVNRAKGIAETPYVAFQGPRVAGFNPTQTQGRAMTLGALGVTARPRPATAAVSTPRITQPAAVQAPMVQGAPVASRPPAMPRPTPQPPAQDMAQQGIKNFLGGGGLQAGRAAPAPGLGMGEEGSGVLPAMGAPSAAPANTDLSENGGGYGAMPPGFSYDEDFDYDPTAAAGYGTLQNAIAATEGVLGNRPREVSAMTGQAEQGRWMGDTAVAQFGGARLGSAPQFEGVRLGDPSLIGGNIAQASFERFGGARLAPASQAEGGGSILAQQIRRGDIRDVTGGVAAEGIDRYLNPYTQQVVDQTAADIERARAVQQVGNDSRAAAARAFGSRNDIVTAETGRAALDATGRATGELRARGFETALGASQADLLRMLQAGVANQGVDLGVLGSNQSATLAADTSNQNDRRTTNLANTNFLNDFKRTQAQMEQEAGINSSRLSAETSMFNTGQTNEGRFRDVDARNRFRLGQGEMDQQRGLENARLRSQYGLAQGGFDQEAGLANADAINTGARLDSTRRDALEAGNVAGRNTFGLADIENNLRGQLANQATDLGYGQLRLGAGAQLGGFANTQRANALADAGVMLGLGGAEQAQQQAYIQSLIAAHDQQQQYPFITQQLLNQSLGLLPAVVNTSTTGNQTVVAPGPDRVGQLIAAGGQAAGAYLAKGSDERIKENVAFVGHDPKGREIFDFDYKPGLGFPEGRFRGVMAQRILNSDPDAVVDIGGVLHVIYERLN